MSNVATHGSGKNADQKVQGGLTVGGTLTVEDATLLVDADGDKMLVTGTTVPTDDTAGFAKGCLFIKTDAVKDTSGLSVNIGTKTECTFKLVTNAA